MDAERALLHGFIYQDGEQWVLADRPGLKSCCLHKSNCVTLIGDFSAYTSDRPLTIEGTWLKENVLADVVVHNEKQSTFPYITIGIVIGLGLILALLLNRHKKPK